MIHIKLLVGENGYINYIKKNYFSKIVVFMTLVVLIFVVSEVIHSDMMMYFKVLSALMMLPTSLFMAKYLAIFNYRSNETNEYNQILKLSDDMIVLSELILVLDDATLFYEYIVILGKEIIVLKKEERKKQSIDESRDIITLILELEKTKASVKVIDNFDVFLNEIQEKLVGRNINSDLEFEEKLRKAILSYAI